MTDPTPNIPAELRREYTKSELVEPAALADPIAQFDRWFTDATLAGVVEANAMTLATADASGAPSARIVLLKGYDARGFAFYTNYQSRKGRELEMNPRAALCLYWQPMERQVRIEGTIERVGREESTAYFHTRPIGSQVGAWASPQSQAIASREELERRADEFAKQYDGREIPLPEFWGGYRVVPTAIEFWQGRASRLHDRLLYSRDTGGAWAMRRLAP